MASTFATRLDRIFEGPLKDNDVSAILASLSSGADPQLADQVAALLQRFSVLVEVNKTVAKSISLDVMLPHLIEVIVEVLHADRATLFLHDSQAR